MYGLKYMLFEGNFFLSFFRDRGRERGGRGECTEGDQGIYEWEALSTEVGWLFMNTIGNLFTLFLFSM